MIKEHKVTKVGQMRESLNLSVKEIARILGKSERTIYRWEKGEASPHPQSLYELETLYNRTFEKNSGTDRLFTFIDLFAGIGGLRKGMESIGGECIFTSEWDSACRETYRANFNCDHPLEGDINSVPIGEIPSHDVLLAGFPCQPFSIAGVSKKQSLGKETGFKDLAQGTLFFDLAQILEYHRPKAFVLENVKNLVSHDKGNTFEVIWKTLTEDLGYNVDYKVIDAKGWLPQHRERIFIVGFLNETDFSFENMNIKNPATGPTLSSILHPEDGSEEPESPYTLEKNAEVNKKYTLTDKLWSYLQNYAAKHKKKGNGFGFGLVGPNDTARTLSARYYKDGSEILIYQGENTNPRRLTPRECSRLMGFDEPEKPPFRIPVSDTQAYKQFGNSVSVPVVRDIAKFMLPYLLKELRIKKFKQLSLIEAEEIKEAEEYV
ncbi:DNA (cytosine-5-)-methyltransferase [Salibacterium lacus]|uniref:Cytosine-specific methyltransferase n=1 Tax=Salibacterium lacus TaxID=1898109 RepID=A0ABW5T4F2_9BACI